MFDYRQRACGLYGCHLCRTCQPQSYRVGYPQGVDANQMMMEIREQAERFGADIRDGEIVKVDFSKSPYVCTTDGGLEIAADTVIIATGSSAKYLGLDDERKYNGQGVSACATCDGFFYRKKTVAVVGGGDTRQEGISDCKETLSACLTGDAAACDGTGEHRDLV